MTIDYLKFDGDSHESSAHWFGMTMLFDARFFLDKFQFSAPQNDTERVRVRTITDHVRHDLSAATRRQIPIFHSAVLAFSAGR